MSDGKSSKHRHSKRESVLSKYIVLPLIFTAAFLILSVAAVCIAMNPVTELVHKVENGAPRAVRDVTLNQNRDGREIEFGDYIADISCENTGLNCKVYYGANRISFRGGAGLSSDYSLFAQGKPIVISGYDSTYFSPLNDTEKGDVITVSFNAQTYKYRVSETGLTDKGADATQNSKGERLVLYSVFSDFSENKDKKFYVYADRINGGEENG